MSILNNQHETLSFSYGAFVWFFGVVEDRMDPEKLGRIRVRIFGYHSENSSDIQKNDLAWAIPIQDISSGSLSGLGRSPTGIVEGTHVFGFFYDGHDTQVPMVLGTLGGIPSEKNSSKGFNDPNGKYPKFLNEPDTNRLSRNEKISETIVQKKKDSLEKGVKKALNKGTWDEQVTPYAAEYPFNHTFESESGIIQEFDDTSGSERYHLYHPSGSFTENHPDGIKVEKITKDKYEIIYGDNNVLIKGECNITVQGNVNLLTYGNLRQEIYGNKDEYIHGNYQLFIGGTLKQRSGGRTYIDAPRIDLNLPGPSITF